AGSVMISGMIALTLSPLLCAKLLNQRALDHPFVHAAEIRVERLRNTYLIKLQKVMGYPRFILAGWFIILFGCGYLYKSTSHELVPREDTGILSFIANAPPDTNINYL